MACQRILNLPNAQRRRASSFVDVRHEVGRWRGVLVVSPGALAVAMPALTRSEINDDSHSAIVPMMVNMALPMGLAVST